MTPLATSSSVLTRAKAGVVLVLAVLVVSGALVADHMLVGAAAEEYELTGMITLDAKGKLVLDEGSATYDLVSGIDLMPFVGTSAVLRGRVDLGILYVRGLTLGASEVFYRDGVVEFAAIGMVERGPDGFQTLVEGIPLTLTGSDELDQVVGEVADIHGELVGTSVALDALRTADGKEIEIQEPETEDASSIDNTCADPSDPNSECSD